MRGRLSAVAKRPGANRILAASIPLVAIWSPLAIIGAVPFALFAGVDALRRRAFDLNDIALAALAVAVALPALLYLQIDAASVGMHILRTNPLIWALCVALEVLPFTVPLLRERESPATDKAVVRLTQFLLLAMPLVQVGVSADFQMRASIMPLALLSILFAQWICRVSRERPDTHRRNWLTPSLQSRWARLRLCSKLGARCSTLRRRDHSARSSGCGTGRTT